MIDILLFLPFQGVQVGQAVMEKNNEKWNLCVIASKLGMW